MLREDFVALIVWLVAVISAVNLGFVAFVFFRRWYRNHYFRSKDRARQRYAQLISTTPDGQIPAFGIPRGAAERDALQELLLLHMGGLEALLSTEVLFQLGYVDRWARAAFGRVRGRALVQQALSSSFEASLAATRRCAITSAFLRWRLFAVPRALALDSLGRLAPSYACGFVMAGLHDPANEVRTVAMASLGRNRVPQAVPMIIEILRKGIEEGHDVSIRAAKAALISYRLSDLEEFIPYLTHANPQLRLAIVDVIREIAEQAARDQEFGHDDFSPRTRELFLDHVRHDSCADVRARCAGVIRWFRDSSTVSALRILLQDENEFVRLHAVRACGDACYRELVPVILEHLTDSRWRVREAAVRTLAVFGPEVRDQLLQMFLATRDRFAAEQIAENLERTGVVLKMLGTLGTEAGATAEKVCTKMIAMRQLAMLTESITSALPERARERLMELLVDAATDELVGVLDDTARKDTTSVGLKAAILLPYAREKYSMSGAD